MIVDISVHDMLECPALKGLAVANPEVRHGVMCTWPRGRGSNGANYMILNGTVEDIAAILPQRIGVDVFKRYEIKYSYPSFMEQELVKEEAATQRLRLKFLAARAKATDRLVRQEA